MAENNTIKYTYINVKDKMVKVLREALEKEGYQDVRVLKADPRETVEIPCIGINRAGDDERNQVLGDSFGTFKDEDTGEWHRFKGTYFNETMEIRIWHKNPDDRDKLYILVKAVLFNLRDSLGEDGLRNIALSGGRDEQENNYPPHPLYWSAINMTYLNPLEVEVDVGVVENVETTLETY